MFEGFYIDNRKVFGKQYNFNGQIICEINNTYGQLKEYNDYGKLIFKEQYLNLERNGYGEEYNGYGEMDMEKNIMGMEDWYLKVYI